MDFELLQTASNTSASDAADLVHRTQLRVPSASAASFETLDAAFLMRTHKVMFTAAAAAASRTPLRCAYAAPAGPPK